MSKQRDASISKDLILQNAIKLFSQKEFSSVSMDSLAKECGLNKAMIFYYYKNKQALYEEVIIYILDEIYTVMIKKNQNLIDPKEQLISFIKTFTLFAWEKPYLSSLLLRELSHSNNSDISQILFANMKKLYKLFCDILKNGENNVFIDNCSKDSMMLYFMIIGTINLMVTTTNIRYKAYSTDTLNTCFECDEQYVLSYVTKQILILILKG